MGEKRKQLIIIGLIIFICLSISSVSSFYIMIIFDDDDTEDGVINIGNTNKQGSRPTAWMKISGDSDDPWNLSFDFSGSSDPDGGDISYFIDFGDGTWLNGSDQETARHRYNELKGYWIEFHVQDSTGWKSDRVFHFVNLKHMGQQYPVAHARLCLSNDSIYMDKQPVLLSSLGSYDIDGEITGYYWDFGDGTNSGEYSNGVVIPHTYENPGSYTARLFVRDDSGNESSTTIEIVILARSC